jgi:hypothetical protein
MKYRFMGFFVKIFIDYKIAEEKRLVLRKKYLFKPNYALDFIMARALCSTGEAKLKMQYKRSVQGLFL